jgi:hypothetical protein
MRDEALISEDALAPATHTERFAKEIAMTHNSMETTNTDEFELTAAYGTAVVMIRTGIASGRRNDDRELPQTRA